ncbi:hypothetical protein [Kibdelosporangium phytohabitans]|uniref:DhaL domain-containing protein n=1 Tax=Kibdelosporangium phytohabitans TaxID=860235 RepID=A0A0N9I682_9PSEU|nr:hypothetical protein [Kibdelosporangium phytohabitans]ALG11188.1 hypothetical protein AOZ06_33750 [Kibdelosporangium phytohabitans]MBE1462450.1 hypothetical protein [Kibdelosporangium phytohabitans]
MSRIREIFETLARGPLGASADGGTMGVGLMAAMARAERGLSEEVETYLRGSNDTEKADAETH